MPLTHDIGVRIPYPLPKPLKPQRFFLLYTIGQKTGSSAKVCGESKLSIKQTSLSPSLSIATHQASALSSILSSVSVTHQAKRPYQPHQALAALPTLPTPVMLSEAKHLSVSTDCEILHYVQNDIVSEWYVATKIITHYSLLTTNYSFDSHSHQAKRSHQPHQAKRYPSTLFTLSTLLP